MIVLNELADYLIVARWWQDRETKHQMKTFILIVNDVMDFFLIYHCFDFIISLH